MRYRTTITLLLLHLLCTCAAAQKDVAWVIDQYPDRVRKLVNSIDDTIYGAGARVQSLEDSVSTILEYYRNAKTFEHLRKPNQKNWNTVGGERVLRDEFIFQGVTGTQRRLPDGRLDWEWPGPRNDPQWTYFLARHEIFNQLLQAWKVSGDERFARRADALMNDWVISNPWVPGDEPNGQWLSINTGIRFHVWPKLFYGMQDTDLFSEGTRLLMLLSLIEQGEKLLRYHWIHQNHALHELIGVAAIAVHWPELKMADEWWDYAALHLLYELEGQVLPDGVQDELTVLYHAVSMRYFDEMVHLAETGGKTLPPAFDAGVEKMYNYLAYLTRPDGLGLENNDSDLQDYRPELLAAADRYEREDWRYIATAGKEGTAPEKTSVLFPYAGHAFLRNGWTADAHWSWFDVGPYGSAHQNNDKLHLSLFYKRALLVDGGRYHYNTSVWRKYLASTFGHNAILVDGFGQLPYEKHYRDTTAVHYHDTPEYTYAQSTFAGGFEHVDDAVRHTRGVLFVKEGYWIVLDRIEAEAPHLLQPLWHFDPACTVEAAGGMIRTTDAGTGNLYIQPLGEVDWTAEVRTGPAEVDEADFDYGAATPFDEYPIRSYYSRAYNEIEPNSVGVYSGRVGAGATTFGWLLRTSDGVGEEVVAEARLRVVGERVEVVVGDDVLVVELGNGQVARSAKR